MFNLSKTETDCLVFALSALAVLAAASAIHHCKKATAAAESYALTTEVVTAASALDPNKVYLVGDLDEAGFAITKTPALYGGTECDISTIFSSVYKPVTVNTDAVVTPCTNFGACVDQGDGTWTQTCQNTCTPHQGAGIPCPLDLTNEKVCPKIDCVTSAWSNPPDSSTNCTLNTADGKYYKTQTRTITTQPANGGAACGVLSQKVACTPINCAVSAWTVNPDSTTECKLNTATNKWEKTATRTVTTQPAYGGTACPNLTQPTGCTAVNATCKTTTDLINDNYTWGYKQEYGNVLANTWTTNVPPRINTPFFIKTFDNYYLANVAGVPTFVFDRASATKFVLQTAVGATAGTYNIVPVDDPTLVLQPALCPAPVNATFTTAQTVGVVFKAITSNACGTTLPAANFSAFSIPSSGSFNINSAIVPGYRLQRSPATGTPILSTSSGNFTTTAQALSWQYAPYVFSCTPNKYRYNGTTVLYQDTVCPYGGTLYNTNPLEYNCCVAEAWDNIPKVCSTCKVDSRYNNTTTYPNFTKTCNDNCNKATTCQACQSINGTGSKLCDADCKDSILLDGRTATLISGGTTYKLI